MFAPTMDSTSGGSDHDTPQFTVWSTTTSAQSGPSPLPPPPPRQQQQQQLQQQPPQPPYKKRLRIPNSCTECRRRKTKCDKGRPRCGQCTMRGVGDRCKYEDPTMFSLSESHGFYAQQRQLPSPPKSSSSGKTPAEREVEELKERLKQVEAAFKKTSAQVHGGEVSSSSSVIPEKNLIYSPNAVVKLYDQLPYLIPFVLRKSRLEYHGAFSPIHRVKNDVHFKIIWIHMWKYLEVVVPSHGKKTLAHYFSSGITLTMQTVLLQFLELKRQQLTLKDELKLLMDSNEELKSLCLKHLPPRHTIHALCTRFFDVIYPFMPLLDKKMFMDTAIVKIIGPWGRAPQLITELYVQDKYDFGHIATLFIVMGLATIVIQDSEYDTNPDFTPLKELSSVLFTTVAEKCLEPYNILRKPYSKLVMQAMVLLKLYNCYCPENDTYSDTSHGRLMTGTIYSMALSLGLDTDPEPLAKSFNRDAATKDYHCHTWRKLWYTILDVDTHEALCLGNPMLCSDDASYDTKLPQVSPYNMSPVELFVIQEFEYSERKSVMCRKISDTCLLRQSKPTVAQVMECIKMVESFREKELGTLKSMIQITGLAPYAKAKKVKNWLELWHIGFALQSLLLTHFKKENNQDMIYKTYCDMLPRVMHMIHSLLNIGYNINHYFDPQYEMFLRPLVLWCITDGLMFLGGIMGQLLHAQQLTPVTKKQRTNALKDLRESILSNMDRALQYLTKVNNGYYNAQRINMALTFLHKMLKDPAFTFENAVREVTSREVPEPDAVKPYDLHGVQAKDVPTTNFFMHLLDSEITHLTTMTNTPPRKFLQPYTGDPVYVPFGDQIFPISPIRFTHRLSSKLSTIDQANAAESDIRKTLAVPVFNTKNIKHIFGEAADGDGNPADNSPQDTNTPSSVPPIIERFSGDEIPGLSLSSDQFSELFGLFDEYTWLNSNSDPFGATQFPGMN